MCFTVTINSLLSLHNSSLQHYRQKYKQRYMRFVKLLPLSQSTTIDKIIRTLKYTWWEITLHQTTYHINCRPTALKWSALTAKMLKDLKSATQMRPGHLYILQERNINFWSTASQESIQIYSSVRRVTARK